MKKLILIALGIAPVLSMAQSSQFTVKGTLSTSKTATKAYLSYPLAGKQVLDSVQLSNGTFSFSGVITDPVPAHILIDHDGSGLKKVSFASDILKFYLDKGSVTLMSKDSIKYATISGSAVNTENQQYINLIKVPEQQVAAANAAYQAAPQQKREDTVFTASLQAKIDVATAEKKTIQLKYIKQNPASFINLKIINELIGPDLKLELIEPLYNSLSPALRTTVSGLEIAKLIAATHTTGIGSVAPDFTMNDTNDQPIALRSFRGKYVLLDFWASWCGPCRTENPNLVKAFANYKDKNFTIIGVSLDQPGKKDSWLAAIKKDGLEWTQLSDLKFWNSETAKLYGIRAIPQNYLLDPDGKIIATNLRGEELNSKLLTLLK
ncbi:TlpA disulfide reductase family protein [Pedobacter hartonius]|uniref:Peroxiredoxin n=1 Tax=Pedobacter hartonius TaxID=425514 RepID=A0A1H4CTZ3_9SPHI|nr:TlpA disulfide reductase family protein [Pedobacter hartonius]SEA63821.1 Peroxiredoxin [Pedobacter hartonius]